MSSFTFADNKTGGRLTAAADAIAAGKLRTAAGIFNELGNELNAEAESTDGLLADEGDTLVLDTPVRPPDPPAPSLTVQQPMNMDTASCAKGAHNFPPAPDSNGWYTCQSCGYVVVTPPSSGPYDMGARQ